MADRLERVNMHNHAKFRGNQSNCYRHIVIFRFSTQPSTIFDFKKFDILTPSDVERVSLANFVVTGETITKISRFFDFQDNGRPPC